MPGNSFATAELGVIAQYAHLAWYLYPTHLADPYCRSSLDPTVPGDPRHFVTDGRATAATSAPSSTSARVGGAADAYGAAVQRVAEGIEVTVGW